MTSATRAFLNLLFLAAVGAGAWVLMHSEQLAHNSELILPPLIVAGYSLVVYGSLRAARNEAALEHYADSIYFLGFMLTLVSLITLFYRFQLDVVDVFGAAESAVAAAAAEEGAVYGGGLSGLVLERSFSHIGIAVSTSLAGVLFRNMVRGALLGAADQTDADEAAGSEEDFALIRQRETEYVQALEAFVSSTGAFSEGLAAQQQQLGQRLEEMATAVSRHEQVLSGYAELGRSLVQSAERVQELAEHTPLRRLNEELSEFSGGVKELNTVLDGVISILEQKVECVR